MNFTKFLPEKVKRFFNIDNDDGGGVSENVEGQQIELPKVTTISEAGPSSSVVGQTEDLTTNQCENLSKALEYFTSSSIERKLMETEKVSMLKFEFFEKFDELDSTELHSLSIKCSRKSIIIFFASKSDEKFSIYWKSNEIEKLLTIKPYDSDLMRTSRTIFEFIAEFLMKSLKNKHLGLGKFDNNNEATEFELHCLADHRGYNILLVAAEMGNLAVVEILMKFNIETESPHKDVNAQSLAYHGQHFHVLLLLLHQNLTFPVGMDVSKCSVEVQDFVRMCLKLHELIKVNNVDQVTEIVKDNPHLCHFFNESNESAVTVALQHNTLLSYEALLVNEIRFGPKEITEDIMGALEYETQCDVREIHFRLTKDYPESHLNIVKGRSALGNYERDPRDKMKLIGEIYDVLNTIPLIRIILMVIAASERYKIILDFAFNHDKFADPTYDSRRIGLRFASGMIFIGAKQLIDKATRHIGLGILAQELCRFAFYLTFRNGGKPYRRNDNQSMQQLEEISKFCEEHQDKEEVIEHVYDNYPKDKIHAELAIRAAQLLAFYNEEPEKLQECKDNFKGLFEFVEEKVGQQMTEAIPDIESKIDRHTKKVKKQISLWTRLLYLSIVFSITLGPMVGFYFYVPTYKFSELSANKQQKVREAIVLYKHVSVKFGDVFDASSKAYDRLSSDHITQMFDGQVLDISDIHLYYLDEFIFFGWANLTGNLREKVLDTNTKFQGKIVELRDIFGSYPEAFKSLTSEQIRDILNGTETVVGEKVKSEVKFYFERKFIPEDTKMMVFEYEYGYDYVNDRETRDEHYKNRTASKTFQEFSDEFLQKNFDERSLVFDKVKENLFLKINFYNLNHEFFHFMHRNSTELIEQTRNEKFLILSSEAGAGKTVTFENLAIKIKQEQPTQWVSYINLKDHTKLYQVNITADNVQELLEKILNLGPENEFERKIFEEAFKSGNAILLWNGFDEILPNFREFISNLFKFIHENTKNVQFVCTRPLYSEQLSKIFKIRTWQLVTLDENERREFLRKVFVSQNVADERIEENIEKVEEIVEKLQFKTFSQYNFNTPLMLKLVAEIHENEKLSKSANLYEIYEIFIDKKINIWAKRGEGIKKAAPKLWRYNVVIKNIFQKYALLNNFNLFHTYTLGLKLRKLQIMRTEIPEDFPVEDLSSMGILYINGKNNFEFAHRTFSEFFVAQFFIENIYEIKDFVEIDEAELRLELFFRLTQSYGQQQKIITDFMSSYFDDEKRKNRHKNFSKEFSQLLRTKFKKFFIRMLDTNYPDVFNFLFKFFQNDHELLVELLHVNEDETFYTAIFNPNYFGLFTNPEEIKSLAQNCLTDDEFQKFLNGKNQKGKNLFGMHFYGLLGITKGNELYDTEYQTLNGTLFWEFFYKVNESLTIDEQKELFVTALSPKNYLFYSKNFNTPDFLDYEKMWTNYENLLTQDEMQDALGNALIQYYEIYPGDKAGRVIYLNLLLEKVEKFLSNYQIYEMFLSKNILHEDWYPSGFRTLWIFLSNRTTAEERREILLKDDLDDKNFSFNSHNDDKKEKFSIDKYRYFYYDFTPFKIFHRSLTKLSALTFDFTIEIYKENFNKSELQDIILSSHEFLYYAVGEPREELFVKFVSFLEDLFEGNEESLKEFLDQKVKSTHLTIFEFVEDFRGNALSQLLWFNNLKTLTDMYDRIKVKVSLQEESIDDEN